MKLNENFILKTIAGSPVVVPVGEDAARIKGMITLNGPAEVIWKCLEEGKDFDEVLVALKAKYDAPEDVLKKDLTALIKKMKGLGIIIE